MILSLRRSSTEQRRARSICDGNSAGYDAPPNSATDEGAEEGRVGGLEVCGYDAGLDAVSGDAGAVVAVVEGAGVD